MIGIIFNHRQKLVLANVLLQVNIGQVVLIVLLVLHLVRSVLHQLPIVQNAVELIFYKIMLVAVHVLLVIIQQIMYVSNAINTVVHVPQQLFVLLAKRICCYTQTFVMMYAPMDRTT